MSSTSTHSTVFSLFANRVTAKPDVHALLISTPEGTYVPHTWLELHQEVMRWAAVLAEHGVRPGDPVVQWSPNCFEWILADLALQALQAIHVPLHDALSSSQAATQLAHCGARLALVDLPDKIDSLRCGAESQQRNLKTLCYAGGSTVPGASRYRMVDLVPGASVEDGESAVAAASRSADEEAVATILYSSGTTGHPNGVALSHRNVVSNAVSACETFGEREDDVRLCVLPLSHIYARTCDLYSWIVSGSQMALARSRETILRDCQVIRPTLINAVPYFYDRIERQLSESDGESEPDSLRKLLGGEIRACCCGGAALSESTFEFFHQRGVPLLPGYGLTEASPVVSLSTLPMSRIGTVGQLLPGVEVRFAEDGEILVRGPNVMLGYWGDDESTADAIVDDWLRTGDIGELDNDGYLKITGRKKEIIITATGKNIFPAHIESLLSRDPLIDQVIVVGDDRKYLTALLVPNEDALRRQIIKLGIRVWGFGLRALLRNRRVQRIYHRTIRKRLSGLAEHEQVKRFEILSKPFTQQTGHLTPKMSLCRNKIQSDLSAEIERLYARPRDRQ